MSEEMLATLDLIVASANFLRVLIKAPHKSNMVFFGIPREEAKKLYKLIENKEGFEFLKGQIESELRESND
jgi:ssDNA-specific exonuclease RecJ